MANTNPARGMRDFLPADVRKRNYVIGIIKEVYESYGFEPLETPAVENIETLTGKYGEEGNQLIFKILKRGEKLNTESSELSSKIRKALQTSSTMSLYDGKLMGAINDAYKAGEIDKDNLIALTEMSEMFVDLVGTYRDAALSDLALRYDLTVPLARVVANNRNELPKFFKRYQIQPVWRADRPARGRFREFYQCDVDAIGSSSIVIEAELISAASKIFTRLGFEDFTIRLNHREILRDLLFVSGIGEPQQTDALIAIDKLDKIGREGVLKEFESRGISKSSGEIILKFLTEVAELKDNSKIYSALEKFIERDAFGANELRRIIELCENPQVEIDPTLARGLSYYTGTIMEINVPDLAGSLGGGGRYDGLIGMFGKEQIPACGFSLGLERILVVMEERNMFPPEIAVSHSADVMVTIWNEDSIGESLKLANELRQQNLRVILYPEADKLGKQFKYAAQINVPYVCVLGESELAENKVTLKNMQTGEQETLGRDGIASRIKS